MKTFFIITGLGVLCFFIILYFKFKRGYNEDDYPTKSSD